MKGLNTVTAVSMDGLAIHNNMDKKLVIFEKQLKAIDFFEIILMIFQKSVCHIYRNHLVIRRNENGWSAGNG
ncbi:MAG: hypothetical protein IJM50_01020 [Lachnospiraceae bacterium]|nr:hypothetical protein [Lachnospiraceae bacterium]